MDRSFCDVVKGTRKSAPRAASRTRADGASKLPESRPVVRESGGLTGNSGSPSQAVPSRSSGVDKVGRTLSGNKVGVKVNPVAVPATSGHASEGEVGWKVATGKRKRREEKALANPGPAHPLPVIPKGGVSTGGAVRRAPTGPRQTAPSAGGALSKGSGGTSSSSMERNIRSGKASRRPGGVFVGVGNPSAAAPRGRQGALDVARVSDLRGKASLGYVSPLAPIQAEHDQHKSSECAFPAPPSRGRRVVSKTDVGTAAETLRGPSQKIDSAQKSRAEPKDAATTVSKQRTRARDVPQGKEATKAKRFKVDAGDIPQGKEAKRITVTTKKLPHEKKAAGVSRSKTPLRVSGAKRTAKPRTDSTTVGCDVGKALARPRVGAVGSTETGQARIDSKRRRESGGNSQGVENSRAGNTGTKKGAKVANRADASVKRRDELVSVAKRVLAANETIESLGQKRGVGVRARAKPQARGQE